MKSLLILSLFAFGLSGSAFAQGRAAYRCEYRADSSPGVRVPTTAAGAPLSALYLFVPVAASVATSGHPKANEIQVRYVLENAKPDQFDYTAQFSSANSGKFYFYQNIQQLDRNDAKLIGSFGISAELLNYAVQGLGPDGAVIGYLGWYGFSTNAQVDPMGHPANYFCTQLRD